MDFTEDDIFFGHNIGFNKETFDSFPRDSEYYKDVTHFDHIIRFNDEVSGSFPSDIRMTFSLIII